MRDAVFESLHRFHLQHFRTVLVVFWTIHTSTRMLLRLPVMALFFSASVGGSTKSAVFSSSESNGSEPFLVTHGSSLGMN